MRRKGHGFILNARQSVVGWAALGLLGVFSGLAAGQRLAPQVVWQPLPTKGPDVEHVLRIAGPPLSLTASDGSGLILVSMVARAVVEDPLCFTELKLTFRNPQPRQLEGQFEITLPPGAAISRFAMRQGDTWQEGEVVELQAARAAYEDFLHRRQDPALLEKQAGNQFHARVFPIPPSGEKELILSYSEERPRADQPYRIYLRGLPRLQRLDIRAVLAKSAAKSGPGGASSLGGTAITNQSVEVQKADFQPDVDFEVPVPVPAVDNASFTGLRHENLLVARVTAAAAESKPIAPKSVAVLFDTSASRALGFSAQVDGLLALLAELRKQAGGQFGLRVIAFDQETEEIFAGRAADFGAAQVQRLKDRRPLGASDLGRALHALLTSKGSPAERVVVVSDGVATAGETEAPALQDAVRKLSLQGVRRLDVVRVGGIHDETLLSRLLSAGLPEDGVMVDGDLPAGAVAYKLMLPTLSKIQVTVPGSQWVWPLELSGIQPGDQVLVYADLPPNSEARVALSGAVHVEKPVTTFDAPRPLLERAWVGARISRIMYQRDTLAASDEDLREGLRHQIIDLSTRFRVLSDFTALLVLETEADYARFNIDRRALTDILTVGATGIEVISRKNQPTAIALPPPPPPIQIRRQSQLNFEGDTIEGNLAKPDAPGVSTGKQRKDGATKKSHEAGHMPMPAAEPPASMSAAAEMPTAGAAPPPAASPVADVTAAPPAPPPPAPAPMTQPSVDRREMARAEEAERRPMPKTLSVNRAAPAHAQRPPAQIASGPVPPPPPPPEVNPYEGKLRTVMDLLKQKRTAEALKEAWRWRDEDAGDVLALVAVGEVLEATNQLSLAARAYGSIIDLFPGRADLRRFAGGRLERVASRQGGEKTGSLALAADTFAKARSQRPDHPNSHRTLAYALLRLGRFAEAFEAIVGGATRRYPEGRFRGVDRILLEDVGLIAAAWLRKEPTRASEIHQRLATLGVPLPTEPSLRFVLSWETDANDVDFHIFDAQGNHAYYSQRSLPTGGELYADVTTGYGPECFTIPLEAKQRTYPYKLQAHYYSRGPMGYGMGKLEVLEYDGKGGLKFIERPFVIMVDRAFVDLGTVLAPLL